MEMSLAQKVEPKNALMFPFCGGQPKCILPYLER